MLMIMTTNKYTSHFLSFAFPLTRLFLSILFLLWPLCLILIVFYSLNTITKRVMLAMIDGINFRHTQIRSIYVDKRV